LDTLGTGYIKK